MRSYCCLSGPPVSCTAPYSNSSSGSEPARATASPIEPVASVAATAPAKNSLRERSLAIRQHAHSWHSMDSFKPWRWGKPRTSCVPHFGIIEPPPQPPVQNHFHFPSASLLL